VHDVVLERVPLLWGDEEVVVEEDRMWKAVATGAAVGAVALTRPLVERTWRQVAGSEPPGNPAHEDVAWRDAILWAVVSGAVVGLIRLVAQRTAAGAWQQVRGDYPKALASTRP
jgi:Protein of unknown function (DUF4235)